MGGGGLQVTPVLQGDDAEITIETWITEKKKDKTLYTKFVTEKGRLWHRRFALQRNEKFR